MKIRSLSIKSCSRQGNTLPLSTTHLPRVLFPFPTSPSLAVLAPLGALLLALTWTTGCNPGKSTASPDTAGHPHPDTAATNSAPQATEVAIAPLIDYTTLDFERLPELQAAAQKKAGQVTDDTARLYY